MAIPFSKFPENSLNLKKFKRNPKNQKLKTPNSNLKSIWAILSSLFMYISIVYIFNLSPSTLICNTKFWFFISNTLVLILVADFATFYSTKNLDFYEAHVIKDNIATPSTHEEHVIKDNTAISSKSSIDVSTHEEQLIKDNDATSSEGDVIVSNEMVTWRDVREEEDSNPRYSIINAVEGNREKKRRAKCVRSNSESAAVVEAAEERAVVLRRTSSERHDDCGKQRLEDYESNDDQFSRMSNEELNTRFEEFIRRFNRQIRLQALRNRQSFEKN